MLKKFIFFLIFVNSAMLILPKERDCKNIKEVLEEHYSTFIYKGVKNQEFVIRNTIKKIEETNFIENVDDNIKIEILEFSSIENYEKEWIFERLNFSTFIAGSKEIFSNVLLQEPKFPRDYYRLKIKREFPIERKLLFIKLKPINLEIADKFKQFYPNISSNFTFDIELYIFINENYANMIEKEKLSIKKIFYKVFFIQDKSPLNTFDRQIRVFAYLLDFEKR